jgi:hypothetical protein
MKGEKLKKQSSVVSIIPGDWRHCV